MTRTVPPVLNETLDPEQSRAKRKERNKAVRDASVRLGMQLRDKAWRRGEVYCPCCGERMWFPQHETRKGNNSRSPTRMHQKTHRATLDHYTRIADGGTNDCDNLRIICLRCNSDRTDYPPV